MCFFFKQKTAYEMRISDWSSDVCSSDLEGYPAGFTAANNAASSMIAVLIPPSIPLILYSLVSGVSISALFFAGVLPGLIITAAFVIVCNVSARMRGFPHSNIPFDWASFHRLLFGAAPARLLPVLFLVLLRFGIATPTEVSVLATFYALAMGDRKSVV